MARCWIRRNRWVIEGETERGSGVGIEMCGREGIRVAVTVETFAVTSVLVTLPRQKNILAIEEHPLLRDASEPNKEKALRKAVGKAR